ncbi:hypothetical protein [Parabacteroides sp. PF5-6]|uniref:type IX secretion system anionic LPS delivery protein PorZ n=1 Tax=Parabacteroides sp. PF5-6 TaxID=1742403 RepID=UPI0024071F30|nr:hypothetical protein [Parabacteroides sp. PF5-6]MDF9830484.1 hypothetical protein [Parabacteroides sp. PF5-6]
MKRLIYLSLFICCISTQISAQATGSWKSHMAYHNTTSVAEAENNVFAVANGSLYSYNKEDQSYRTYIKKEGELNDTQIKTIAYNSTIKTLLIVYSNGNIDLLNENGIYNIPFLMQATLADKTINHIYFHDQYAYLSAEFGIMVINMEEREIADTYRLGHSIYSTCIHKDQIYAATSKGILYSALNNNLLDPNNWNPYAIQYTDIDAGTARTIVVFQDLLAVLVDKQGIYIQQENNLFKPFYKNNEIKKLSVQNNKLLCTTAGRAYVYFSLTENHSLPTGALSDISSLKDNIYWVASETEMLRGLRRIGATTDYEWFVHGIRIDSPKRDYATFMTFQHGKLWVAGGGRWTDIFNRPGTIMIYDPASESSQWFTVNEADVAKNSPGNNFKDVTSIAVDPQDETHFYASTWGGGVFEFKDNEFVNLYHPGNSTLQSIYNSQYEYIRVEGLCFDKEGNLWMTNSEVSRGIKKMNTDGKWESFNYTQANGQHLVDKILITSANHKWVNILRGGYAGILVFDEASDQSAYYKTFYSINGDISASAYYCMAEDLNGQIWIGTNLGPIICPNPRTALDNPDNMFANRIIREDEYGNLSLFMDGETVRAIAVDGANRKWLGTQNSGLLLVSADGMETIEHFTAENSPLPSNYVESIAINHETGEVFIGTDKGIVSYMGTATAGEASYSDVYAYPNPVRPNYQGDVVITGLMADSNVKITDINGHLIVQGKSLGGQFVWDCRKSNGDRVSTGIYLVLASEPNKGESVVSKIMVIK